MRTLLTVALLSVGMWGGCRKEVAPMPTTEWPALEVRPTHILCVYGKCSQWPAKDSMLADFIEDNCHVVKGSGKIKCSGEDIVLRGGTPEVPANSDPPSALKLSGHVLTECPPIPANRPEAKFGPHGKYGQDCWVEDGARPSGQERVSDDRANPAARRD